MKTQTIIRIIGVTARVMLVVGVWLLPTVPQVAAQPLPSNARTVLVVSRAPSTDPNVRQVATLDEAIEAAGSAKNPLILVDPGEYTLRGAVTSALELRARTLGTAPLPPLDWATCVALSFASPTPAVVISTTGTDPALRLSLTNPEARVTLAGVGLKGSAGTPAAVVGAGELLVRESRLTGRLVVTGSSARASLASVSIGSVSPVVSPALAGIVSGGVGAYGLPFAANDSELALIAVTNGASFQARNLEIYGHTGVGICVDAATAMLCGGSIHDIEGISTGGYGRGANILRGGRLTLHGVHIYRVREAGVAATGSGTQVLADQGTRIEKVSKSREAQLGVGILGQSGATVAVDEAILGSCEGPGLYLSKGATGTVTKTALPQNEGAGIVVYGATLTLNQSTVEHTSSSPSEGMGLGIYIDSRIFGASSATISGCTVQDNRIAGVWVEGTGGAVTVTGTTLARHLVGIDDGFKVHGNGVFANEVCSGLVLTGNRYTGNAGAHVFLSGSNATLSGSSYVTNGVLDFTQERCTQTCVSPLTEAALVADGLSSKTHLISLCPEGNTLTLSGQPEFAFGQVEVTPH